MNQLKKLKQKLNSLANPAQAAILQRFFKTGTGEYGSGDTFLGIYVPKQREVAKKYLELTFGDIQKLLSSKIHEYRFVGLIILTESFKRTTESNQEKIYNFYLKNYRNINNWDLVDITCPNIVGNFLLSHPREILYDFARSNNLWKKRIAIISTLSFIRQNQFTDTLKLSQILLKDKHDLIHKAVGWMLREVGKRNVAVLLAFLNKYYSLMPRTMLRYAIEKLPEAKRRHYLKK